MNEEVLNFAAKLIDRTDEGKLPWKETADDQTFLCVLDGDVVFEVRRFGDNYMLEMRDDEQLVVFSSRAFVPESRTTSSNDQLYEFLSNLYEKARRSALRLDEKVKRASKLLDAL